MGRGKQSEDSRGPSYNRFRTFLVNSSGLCGSELLLEDLVEGDRTHCVGKPSSKIKDQSIIPSGDPMAPRNPFLQDKILQICLPSPLTADR
jgi:hypothetical protein